MKEVNKASLNLLLEEIRKGPVEIVVASPGGDFISAMKFVDTIKKEGLEKNISLKIKHANSAAAYIVLSFGSCKRSLEPGGSICTHGGEIAAKGNAVVIGKLGEWVTNYYNRLTELISPYVSVGRMTQFHAQNRLKLTNEECRLIGITVPET